MESREFTPVPGLDYPPSQNIPEVRLPSPIPAIQNLTVSEVAPVAHVVPLNIQTRLSKVNTLGLRPSPMSSRVPAREEPKIITNYPVLTQKVRRPQSVTVVADRVFDFRDLGVYIPDKEDLDLDEFDYGDEKESEDESESDYTSERSEDFDSDYEDEEEIEIGPVNSESLPSIAPLPPLGIPLGSAGLGDQKARVGAIFGRGLLGGVGFQASKTNSNVPGQRSSQPVASSSNSNGGLGQKLGLLLQPVAGTGLGQKTGLSSPSSSNNTSTMSQLVESNSNNNSVPVPKLGTGVLPRKLGLGLQAPTSHAISQPRVAPTPSDVVQPVTSNTLSLKARQTARDFTAPIQQLPSGTGPLDLPETWVESSPDPAFYEERGGIDVGADVPPPTENTELDLTGLVEKKHEHSSPQPPPELRKVETTMSPQKRPLSSGLQGSRRVPLSLDLVVPVPSLQQVTKD